MRFNELGLAPDLLRALADHGYTEPTPIQAQAIPIVLAGQDLTVSYTHLDVYKRQGNAALDAAAMVMLNHLLARLTALEARSPSASSDGAVDLSLIHI